MIEIHSVGRFSNLMNGETNYHIIVETRSKKPSIYMEVCGLDCYKCDEVTDIRDSNR